MLNATDFSRLYAKTYGVTLSYSATMCESVFALLYDVLYNKKEDVTIYGFGSFKHQKMAAKRARHPGTGKMITIPERDVVKFRQSETVPKLEDN